MSTQTESQNADRIKEEVRQVVRHLTELSQTSDDFDSFCSEVLGSLVDITGAHGALFWQITGQGVPRLTHHSGRAPHDRAREILNPHNEQHNGTILDVVRDQKPACITSDKFVAQETGEDQSSETSLEVETPSEQNSDSIPFLMMLAPVFNRQKNAVGAVELVQRGDVSDQAQDGYLRFLAQIASLFQRWHLRQEVAQQGQSQSQVQDAAARQELAIAPQHGSKWHEKMEFISEVHRSIDFKETAYAIANESRRVLGADRVSVGRWNGKKCKILSISSQDRFDNRANVVKKLGAVATASCGADSRFWITGSTDHVAPEVARKINDYLDESHSRTLAVIPLAVRPPDVPDLDMKKQSKRVRKLGVIILEYFDEDVIEEAIADDVQLVVEQSQLALENSRKHGEIFLQPVFKKIGWLQQTLFGDHRKKTIAALAAIGLLTLAMIFVPWELKMKVDGILQPEKRSHVYAMSKGIIKTVEFKDSEKVTKGQLLMTMVDYDREQAMKKLELERDRINSQARETYATLQEATSPEDEMRLERQYSSLKSQYESTVKMIAAEMAVMGEVLEVRAPIDGTIVTWNPQQRLQDLPVDPNQILVSISQIEGEWQLDVKIPHIKVGYVDRALSEAVADSDTPDTLPVEFALSTNPSKTYHGELRRVSRRPFTDDAGIQQYRGVVDVDTEDLDLAELKPGAGATVKIHCGKVPLYRACLYQIIDWCKTNLWLY